MESLVIRYTIDSAEIKMNVLENRLNVYGV